MNDFYFRELARLSTKKKSGLSWQTGLITLIWDKLLELWKMRNEDVYARKRYGKQSGGGEKRSKTSIDGNLCNEESHET
jgi:hypothetical protein